MPSCAGLHTESWQGFDRSKLCANADRRAALWVSLVGVADLNADGLVDGVRVEVLGLMYLLAALNVLAHGHDRAHALRLAQWHFCCR